MCPVSQPQTASIPAPAPKVTSCKYCERPSHCPTCNTELAPPPKASATNIDGDVPDIYNQLPPPIHDIAKDLHPEFKHALPPTKADFGRFLVFTAGSIEMGRAIQWQKMLVNHLCNLPITVANPRRGYWNPAVNASDKDREFRKQVNWEAKGLESTTIICFFFDHATMSPVTMFELGVWTAKTKDRVVVCCNKEFWRSGNIMMHCEKFGLPYVETFAELVPLIGAMLRENGMILDKQGNLVEKEEERDPEKSMLLEEAQLYVLDRTVQRPEEEWEDMGEEEREDRAQRAKKREKAEKNLAAKKAMGVK
ncbi:hypothetical protein PSPO01_15372 [Paraphaeosphaeria sporulosa]